MPRFSLICPTMNRPEMLLEAIAALRAQDFTDWELLIEDGGESIKHLLPDDSRIWYERQLDPQDKRGNAVLMKAQGEILNFHADDDTLTPGALRHVHNSIGEHRWMYGRVNYGTTHIMGEPWDRERFKTVNFVPAPAVFWIREARNVVGGWDMNNPRSHDWDYWQRLGAHWEPLYTERVLANYRVHPGMATKTMSAAYCDEMDRIVIERARSGFYDALLYSQNDEQRLIAEAVGGTVGRFLDIGANDGAYLSNTLALVERGWSGVLVEPNPWTFARLVERHGDNPRLTLVNAAVGLEWGMTKFWPATTDTGLSTTEEDQREKRAARAAYRQPFHIAVVPLEVLLKRIDGPVDVLSIDTEGTSVDLFLRFPVAKYTPRVICVEHDGKQDQCCRHAASLGYWEVGRNNENLVFVKGAVCA